MKAWGPIEVPACTIVHEKGAGPPLSKGQMAAYLLQLGSLPGAEAVVRLQHAGSARKRKTNHNV